MKFEVVTLPILRYELLYTTFLSFTGLIPKMNNSESGYKQYIINKRANNKYIQTGFCGF